MKNYLVFFGPYNYPGGGMNDFKGDYDTIEEAKSKVSELYKERDEKPGDHSWHHIYSIKDKRRVDFN